MLETEFLETEAATAFNSWLMLFSPIIEITSATYRAMDVVVDSVDERKDWSPLNASLGFDAPMTYEIAKRHRHDGYSTFNTLTLLAAWGVFEAMVEDVCKATIRMHPELLDADNFGSARRRAERDDIDAGDYVEFVSDRALRFVGGPTEDDDRNKYEKQLELVGLNGDVPDDLSLSIRTAKEVRNVWAHRSGKADSKFIDSCQHLGYAIGDPVTVTVEALNEYIVALNTYAFIMMNRFRLRNGMDAIACYQGDANKFKAGFDRLYPETISPELLQDRLRSELGDLLG